MLSLVTDHQWNRKHIFVKTLTLISKLFPFETKQIPPKNDCYFPLESEGKLWYENPFLLKPPVVGEGKGYHSRDTFRSKQKREAFYSTGQGSSPSRPWV